jgi:hypothetical protein
MRRFLFPFLLLAIAACQPSAANVAPTFPPFPTMTPGQAVTGALPTSAYQGQLGQLAPATAVALSSRPTATPNLAACPVLDGEAELGRRPTTVEEAQTAILRFLQEGGGVNDLKEGIRVRWQMLGETGYVLNEADFTGEGAPEILLGWSALREQGALYVIGCKDGLYVIQHEVTTSTEEPPRILFAGEMNNTSPAELIYSDVACDEDENCVFDTQLLGWDGFTGRFRSLLDKPLNTLEQPQLRDIDNDQVTEVVVEMTLNGNTRTGPLRTGVNIYDWNGRGYTLSIIQLEPPRYYIQIAQEGDRQFSQLRMDDAAVTYTNLINAQDLRYWYNNEVDWLRSYGLYRLLLTYAYLGDPRQVDVATQINTEFGLTSDLTIDQLPVYAVMAYRFLDSLALNGALHPACTDVLAVVDERPEALDLLNRYGTRSPTYTALDLCPF